MSVPHGDLLRRWVLLWHGLSPAFDMDKRFKQIQDLYSESHRKYHTLAHLRHCFAEFDDSKHYAIQPHAIELAIWYHDAIYNPRATDNEEQSAHLAQQVIMGAGLHHSFAEEVARLILMTKHDGKPKDPDAKLFLDIDLSVFGRSRQLFDQYEQEIRQEYAFVPEGRYRRGRLSILRRFIERDSIYYTRFFRKKYEDQARRNLLRSIAKLRD